MKTTHLCVLFCAFAAIGCGRDLNKGKLPANNTSTNVATNGATNGMTNGMTNGVTNVITANNTTANNTTANNTTANNTTANNTTANNTTANNATNNATNNGNTGGIAFMKGEFADFELELNAAGIAHDIVASDDTAGVIQMEAFWLSGAANGYDTIIVDGGRHWSTLEDTANTDAMAVASSARAWVAAGGRFVDLSGGYATNALGIFTFPAGLVAEGSYVATTNEAGLPHGMFNFDVPAQSMEYVAPDDVESNGSAVIVVANVLACTFDDFFCANPSDATTAVVSKKEIGSGVAFYAAFRPPHNDQVVDTILALLTL